jgi:lipid-A-disaccharide synthase
MKIMISAGEASGDLHGAEIAAALYKICPKAEIIGMGGKAMRRAGVDVRYDIEKNSVMGFVEVVKNLRALFRLRDEMVETMRRENVDILVTVDYPDFNMRLAAKAKAAGIKIFSYIPPSAWAWRKGRAKKTAAIADKIAAIFPFEIDVYKKAGADIEFVGNPMVDTVKTSMEENAARKFFAVPQDKKIILLLPGSRVQEIQKLLPVMLKAAERLHEEDESYVFYLPAASTIPEKMLEKIISAANLEVVITHEKTYDLMAIADTAIATSGTVILEAALLGLPSVVLYKMARLTYYIGRVLVRLPNFSLPNIIAGERVLPELLQNEVTADNIVRELKKIAANAPQVRAKLAAVRERLGQSGAAERAARLIVQTVQG